MKKQLALAIALAAAPLLANAGELSYTHVEFGATHANIDTATTVGAISVDDASAAQGGFLRGSYQFGDAPVYVYGSYERLQDDVGITTNGVDTNQTVDTTFSDAQLGIGFHVAVSEKADFFAEVGGVRQDVEAEFAASETDGTGARVSIGVRANVSERFELGVKGSYTGGGDFHSKYSGGVNAHFKINDTWGVIGDVDGGSLGDGTEYTAFRLGVRASF